MEISQGVDIGPWILGSRPGYTALRRFRSSVPSAAYYKSDEVAERSEALSYAKSSNRAIFMIEYKKNGIISKAIVY